jgi:hypothetical protein
VPGGLRGDRRRRPRATPHGPDPPRRTPQQASLIASRHSELFASKLQRFLGHYSVTFALARYASHFSYGMLEPEEYLTDG